MKRQLIGIIGYNKQDCQYLQDQMSAPLETKFYHFTVPSDPDGFMLDVLIETVRAKGNRYYDEIRERAYYCLMKCGEQQQ